MIWRVTACLLLAAAPAGAQEEELPVLVRSFAKVDDPAPPFRKGEFDPRPGETIAFIGGTDTFNQQRFGFLEERIQLAWPERKLKIRNLGWQGDTIYHQARPRFFYTEVGDPQPGSSPDTRQRAEPGVILIQFGKLESIEGTDSLPRFLAAYETLLDLLESRTQRIVLITPAPFFKTGPTRNLADSRNAVLATYVDGIRLLAKERAFLFADTFTPMLESIGDPNLSSNGIHLSEAGQRRFADILSHQLAFPVPTRTADHSAALDSLRQSIQRKNRLWHQYYHPTNWAFLFGDRQHVPASRDHEDTRKRWFIKEVDALPPLIAETETDIHRYAIEAARRR